MQFPYWSLVLDHSGFHLSCFWCLWKLLLMRYFPLAVLPCDGNFHLEWEQRGKITKEETQRASADDGKGYSEAKMETSGNKPMLPLNTTQHPMVNPLTIPPQPSVDGHDLECRLQYTISSELTVKMSWEFACSTTIYIQPRNFMVQH